MLGKNLKVTLDKSELMLASMIGATRQIEAKQSGLHDAHGFVGAGWNEHIEGAAGELAVSKAANRYWAGGVNTFKAADLMDRVQIRTRSGGIRSDLIVRHGDKDDDIFVLVVGRAPEFTVVGWTLGALAKQGQFRQSYGGRVPAFFVPASELMPFPITLPGAPKDTDYF